MEGKGIIARGFVNQHKEFGFNCKYSEKPVESCGLTYTLNLPSVYHHFFSPQGPRVLVSGWGDKAAPRT